MPYANGFGPGTRQGASGSVLTVREPVQSGTGSTVAAVPQSAADVAAGSSQAALVIPSSVAPNPGNLPANARAGELFMFASNPAFLYWYGTDGVWYAITGARVS